MTGRNVRRPRPGLRERKRIATRRALSAAALNLAMEHGLDNVLIEDIADEAGVALRTFRNYFSSKYEAICAPGADRALRIGDALRRQPADKPIWDAITMAVLSHYEGADKAPDREWMAGLKLVTRSPELQGEYLKVNSQMQRILAEAIAERADVGPDEEMFAQVIAGAVIAASQVAIRRWADAEPPVPLMPLLRRALDQLATPFRPRAVTDTEHAPGPLQAGTGAQS
jgi:AcrR family transcriptional regulator